MVIDGIEIELIRKRVKNVNLRIHTPDGRVTVSAPRRTSEAFIAEFVAAKAPWIRKQQARIAAMPPRPELTYTHGEEHAFLGHPYPLEIYAAAGRPGAEFQSGFQSSLQSDDPAESPEEPRLVVHARDPRDPAEVKRHIDRAYRRELQTRLDELVPEWEQRLGVKTTKIRIRAMKRKWGACRTRTRRRRVQPRAHQAPATRHRIFGVARTRSLDRGIPQRTLPGHPHRAHAGLAGSRGHAQRPPLMAAASDGRKSMSPL